MKRFLLLQLRPEDEISDNEYETFLKFGEFKPEEVERVRTEKNGIPELDMSQYCGVLVGGSPFDVSTPEENKSDIQKKIEADFEHLFDYIIKNDFPFMGACSGNGLLGNYCGATISKTFGEDVGGIDINITEEGLQDPLLKDFPNPFRALVGHKEACDAVPENAVLLASSKTCPVQMFRIGDNIYATQFHPEADPEAFALRINVYKHNGYFPPEIAQELIDAVEDEETPYAHEVLKRFVEQYRT